MNTEPNFKTKNHYTNTTKRLQREGWTRLNEGPFVNKCTECLVNPACNRSCQYMLLYECIEAHGINIKETAEVYYKWEEKIADVNIHILYKWYSIIINDVFGRLQGSLSLKNIFVNNEKEIQK